MMRRFWEGVPDYYSCGHGWKCHTDAVEDEVIFVPAGLLEGAAQEFHVAGYFGSAGHADALAEAFDFFGDGEAIVVVLGDWRIEFAKDAEFTLDAWEEVTVDEVVIDEDFAGCAYGDAEEGAFVFGSCVDWREVADDFAGDNGLLSGEAYGCGEEFVIDEAVFGGSAAQLGEWV